MTYPAMIPYNQFRRDPEVLALAEQHFGGTETVHVFHVLTLMCMPVYPEEQVDGYDTIHGGCLFYAWPLWEGGTTTTELWTLGVSLGASAVWTFEKFGSGVSVIGESDTEPFHRRTMDLLDRSTWLVLRSPAQVRALQALDEPVGAG